MRPPVPPFTAETAAQKVQAAEDAWNSRDPARVAAAYTPDTRWRNRSEFLTGRQEVEAFLARKWAGEHEYALRKSLWAFSDSHIAVRFQYEWHDDAGQWWRSYGNENWEFDAEGTCAGARPASTTWPSPRVTGGSSVPAPKPSAAPSSRCADR